MDIFYWILGLLGFILVLAVSIGLHEAGHMGVAKWFKLDVPKFFVGFGPTVWSKKTDKTEYGIKAIPLGGFVMIEDNKRDKNDIETQMLSHVPPYKRVLVFLAGPLVNIVLGTSILLVVLMGYPTQYVTNTIKTVNTCEQVTAGEASACGAETAGLLKDDEILSINGHVIAESDAITEIIADLKTADLEILRNGETIALSNVPITNGKIGINLVIGDRYIGFGEAFSTMGDLFVLNVEALAKLPSKVPAIVEGIAGKEVKEDIPASVVAVGKTYGDVTASKEITIDNKFKTLLTYSGLLNIGLGFINLLPIMPLDGGRMLIAGIDQLRIWFSKFTKLFKRQWKYTPVSIKMVSNMTLVTATAIFGYMGLIIVSDIMQIIRGSI